MKHIDKHDSLQAMAAGTRTTEAALRAGSSGSDLATIRGGKLPHARREVEHDARR